MFELKKAKIYHALRWERLPIFRLSNPFKKIFFVLGLISLFLFVVIFFSQTLPLFLQRKALGISILFWAFWLLFWYLEKFFNQKIKKIKPEFSIAELETIPLEYNLAEFLDYQSAKAVWKAKNSLEKLLYCLLADNPELNFIFGRNLLDVKNLKKELKKSFKVKKEDKKEIEGVIRGALKIAQKRKHSLIRVEDLLVVLAQKEEKFRNLLVGNNLQVKDIEETVRWLEDLKEEIKKKKNFWEWENLTKRGSLAREWTAGYTINLDRFSFDLSETLKKRGFPKIIGHQSEIEAVERILTKREINNVLLVGEPGSGRKSIVEAVAIKSICGKSFPEINYKRFTQLDLPFLFSQAETLDEAELLLDTMFQEAVAAGNVILIIEDFHNYIGGETRAGVSDISGIISRYLHLPEFQLIAITDFEGLHTTLELHPSILNLFEKVEVLEVSSEETLKILENLTLFLEKKYKVFISYPALKEIVKLSEKYLPAKPFPEKAIELLDETVIYVSKTLKEKIVLKEHVDKIVREKTQVPVGEIEVKEKEVLLNLENLIHKRIINQEEAVKEVSTALRRARAEITVRKGPMGCFLFLGPTGVGKTETSKALAEIYFGSEEKMVRLDMSEFQDIKDIPRLIGKAGQEGLLITPVRENPFSLILLDEIEKAHPNILNLFLQVLDEGHITDGTGKKVDFKNTIIIATSNAGYKIILKAIKEKKEWSNLKEELLNYLFNQGIFRPEFINRFDAVVIFKPLSKENLLDIAELLLKKLKNNLKEKGIDFVITLPLKEKIVELGYNPTFGAREMRRVIQDKIENPLAKALLAGQLKKGQRVAIDPQTFQPLINP